MEYMWIAGNKKGVKELVKALRANGFTFDVTHYAETSNSPHAKVVPGERQCVSPPAVA